MDTKNTFGQKRVMCMLKYHSRFNTERNWGDLTYVGVTQCSFHVL